MKPYSVTALSCLLLALYAAQGHAETQGMSGVLDILGSLVDTPCALDMSSADQAIDLGNVSRSQLLLPGDEASPVAFLAPADEDDPRLVKVSGVSGLGLRLTDALGRDVRLGARGEPLFLAHGNDTLNWQVQPTRTAAALSNGAFRAAVDFRLMYE